MSAHFPMRRTGVTLVELLVVLVLLGIAGALVVPAWRASIGRSSGDETGPFDTARRLAARRGESMRLDVSPTGAWRVVSHRDSTTGLLAAGTGGGTPEIAPARSMGDIAGMWVVSPTGLCVPVPGGAAPHASAAWNPVQCAPAR